MAQRTAVVVPVPEADPVVGPYRDRLDVAASWGVPAHITVLFPFVDPMRLDDGVLDRLATVIATVAAFTCRFSRTQWFDEDVVWLHPEPDAPFRALTAAVDAEFPDYPPYGGAFDDVVPHLTIGERGRGSRADLRAAEAAVQAALPLEARIERAQLLIGSERPGSWRVLQSFALG